ncbi:hypothetical protein ACJX0J_010070, partial [Zea mays]
PVVKKNSNIMNLKYIFRIFYRVDVGVATASSEFMQTLVRPKPVLLLQQPENSKQQSSTSNNIVGGGGGGGGERRSLGQRSIFDCLFYYEYHDIFRPTTLVTTVILPVIYRHSYVFMATVTRDLCYKLNKFWTNLHFLLNVT